MQKDQGAIYSGFLFTVNPRICPRGLIVNFEILHGGLIEGGGSFEVGGLLKIIIFLHWG